MNFWETVRGHHLAEVLIRELPSLTEELKRANDLKEKELKLQESKKGGDK